MTFQYGMRNITVESSNVKFAHLPTYGFVLFIKLIKCRLNATSDQKLPTYWIVAHELLTLSGFEAWTHESKPTREEFRTSNSWFGSIQWEVGQNDWKIPSWLFSISVVTSFYRVRFFFLLKHGPWLSHIPWMTTNRGIKLIKGYRQFYKA